MKYQIDVTMLITRCFKVGFFSKMKTMTKKNNIPEKIINLSFLNINRI